MFVLHIQYYFMVVFQHYFIIVFWNNQTCVIPTRYVFNNAPCWEYESLRHFYVECPASTEIFSKLRRCILEYTDNVNRYPVISDIQFLFGDFSSSKKKIRTAIWLLSVSLSYIYEAKMDSKIPVSQKSPLKEQQQLTSRR